MLRLTRQNMTFVNPTLSGLSGPELALAAETAIGFLGKLKSLFGGSSNPWISGQNQAAAELAKTVADYVGVKNANQLTALYIGQAIARINVIASGFRQFAAQYNSPGAAQGSKDIQANADAIIQNMRFDLSILPSGTLEKTVTTITSGSTAGIPNVALIGLAAVFLLPKLRKR